MDRSQEFQLNDHLGPANTTTIDINKRISRKLRNTSDGFTNLIYLS